MRDTTSVRYNINATKTFDTALRELVRAQSISSFFVEAATKELKRRRRERAMQLVTQMPDPFPTIDDPAAYIHSLRREDTTHRLDKQSV